MDGASARLRFSLEDVPEAHRVETLRDVFGRSYANIDFTPLTERPELDVETIVVPGVRVTQGHFTPHSIIFNHQSSLASDDFTLVAGRAPKPGRAKHVGKEITSGGDGSAYLITCAEPSMAETQSVFWPCAVTVTRSMLLPLLPNAEDALMKVIPASNPALVLLKAYVAAMPDEGLQQSPELAHAVATHIRDLIVLAVGGAGRDSEMAALEGGARAARLVAIKQWTLKHLCDPSLSVTKAAATHCVSPRYIQMLFEREGLTFTQYVLGQRLELAHRVLEDPGSAQRAISHIAFGAGFGDVSHFNRVFRALFGESPSDVRHRASREAR